MSSILKALKKIDETSDAAEDGHPWPHSGETRDAITRSIKKRWFLRRLTTYILVAACLISLVALIYLRQNAKSEQRQASVADKTAAGKAGQVHRAKIERTPPPGSQPNAGVDRQKRAVPRPEPQATPISPAQKRPPEIGRTTPKTGAISDRLPPPATEPRKPLPKRSKKAATKITPPAAGKNGLAAPATAPAGSPKTAPRSKNSPQYDRLEDNELILQAIAWSPEPTERIAVINGSIVREGETVGGFTLMNIRPDDIVLNDGSKSWQLDFPLKQ